MIRRAVGLALAILAGSLASAGCGGGGHGGGFGTSIAPVTSAPKSGPDLTPPEVVVSQPARGAFLPPGPVRVVGRVTDSDSGVATLTVQGAPVAFNANGDFSTSVTLPEGVSGISITAIDKAGNRTDRTLSVETGNYFPANQVVPGALAGRINSSGLRLMEKIAAQQIAALTANIGATLKAQNPIFDAAGVTVSIDSVSFGTPTLMVDSSTAGLVINIAVPNVAISVTVDAGGLFQLGPAITADMLTVGAVVQLQPGPTGSLDVVFSTVAVNFQNFRLDFSGAPSWVGTIISPTIQGIVQNLAANLIKTQGQDAVRKLVGQTANTSFGGTAVTFTYQLLQISTDSNGILFDVGINLEMTPDPSFPPSPGSLASLGGMPQSFAVQPTAVFSISETALNRAFHQAWQSGLLETTVVPSVVAQKFGVPLPIGATGQDLVNFLPSLKNAIPSPLLAAPVVYRIRSLLPPTAKLVAGAPDPLQIHFGEYQITASIDKGGGQLLDVFTVSAQTELQIGLGIKNGALVPIMSSLPNPPLATDLVAQPLAPLGAAHIESYLNAVLPMLMGGIVSNFPPMPLPSIMGAQIVGATVKGDGPNGTYLTIEADVR